MRQAKAVQMGTQTVSITKVDEGGLTKTPLDQSFELSMRDLQIGLSDWAALVGCQT